MNTKLALEIFGMWKTPTVKQRADELEYLKWFRLNADFGPASGDVTDQMNELFMAETGKNLPEGWNYSQDGEVNDNLET